MQSEKVFLSDANFLEFSPPEVSLSTGDERLAALVAYMTGDGALAVTRRSYARISGEISTYSGLKGAFYSNSREDLEIILDDLRQLGLCLNASVCRKKTKPGYDDGYQLQLAAAACKVLVDAGAPVGRKTSVEFLVPDWILQGSLKVKRAYIAALFGAEGATPVKDRSSKSRMPRQPVLNMCKRYGYSGFAYFEQLKGILADLGVKASVSATGTDYVTYWLRIGAGAENLIDFFENVGFTYCREKHVLAWQWAKYLRAYRAAAQSRRSILLKMRADGESYEAIGRAIGVTKGAAYRMLKDIDAGRITTAGHSFPHFDDWIATRWIPELSLLRLEVASRSFRSEPQRVFNMLVSSPDHSYLLASGANNFNSFETMSGRVYYTFDRATHVGDYPFNPQLPLHIGMDFNIDPMSAVICQEQPDGEIWVVDEVVLFGSNVQETADEIARRYYRYMKQINIYPDPAGNNRNHDRGETSLDVLREAGFNNIYFKRKHPLVADRVNSVNRLFKTAEGESIMRVNRTCRRFIDSAEQTIYKAGTREVDKSLSTEHSMDAFGYYVDFRHPMRKLNILGVSI